MSLGWSKALSTVRTEATGTARLDLVRGRVLVEVMGLDQPGEVWLVDNRDAPNDTAAPEPHDRHLRLGRLSPDHGRARLAADLGPRGFRNLDADMVVVTAEGTNPTEGGILFGMPCSWPSASPRWPTWRIPCSCGRWA